MANEGCSKAVDSPFSSDKHAQLILAQINKMRNGQHFCDVQLQVGKETFNVHRLVLAASSPYFAALFTGGMKESSKDVVQILGIEAGIFQLLLDFIYTGIPDFNLHIALQTLLKEYCEVSKSPKENKFCSFLQTSKVRPRKKARKYLYAVGGYTRLQGARWSDSRALSCVERFDTFSQYWTTVSSLHQARCGLGVAVLGGMVYAIGGEKDSMIFDCTECYDPVTKQWTTVASMNHPRCGFGVCVCYGAIYALGLIYVMGGISNEGIELHSFEVYDPFAKRWSPLPPMGTRRAYLGVVALNDSIYAVGGWNETQDALHTVEKYSFEEEKWVEVASMKVPRAGMCVVAVNGLLYVAGGRSSIHDFSAPGTLDSVEVYNPHSDTWTEIGKMITSRCEAGVAVL
ncbi:Actin-binding protein IPP [Fukomys damarensis]|uniref:Actin-binding protein IPP n=1 Tax=Fukomys damarensis TaxID=885580 RepID=A0A091CTJ0_FUKDA|nr:Actin-binding protein IPP [Fukomys damarensis]